MPALETGALLLALKWQTRAVQRLGRKFLHLADSQSALGYATKHRSSANSLQYLAERSSALQIASRLEPIFGFVGTRTNPTDRPSRW